MDAIVTELQDGANAAKAKEMIQPAVKAIESLIQEGQADWAVEGFQLFQSMLDAPQPIITSAMVASLVKWAAIIFRQTDAEQSGERKFSNILQTKKIMIF